MAIVQTQCTIFKENLLKGLENFAVGTPYFYAIALYDANANLGAGTLEYTGDNEVVGEGYYPGGLELSIIPPASSGSTAYVSFQPVVWTPASFTCRGALIYNAVTYAAVAVMNFGSDKTATNSFTITFPTADASNAIIRIS
jgi:hypothetical protein